MPPIQVLASSALTVPADSPPGEVAVAINAATPGGLGRGGGRSAPLSAVTLAAYSAMALGPSIFSLAINVMLPQLYAKELGLSLEAIGVSLLTIRIFDSFSDQIVGFLSDHTRARFGSRKPWMIAGTVVTLLACYFLFQPPANCSIGYFAAWRLVYDIGWTMTTVTYSAWGAELSTNYDERSRINGYSGVSTNLGVVIKNLAPIMLFWFGVTKSSAFSLDMFRTLFWVFLPIIVVLTTISVIVGPAGAMLTKPKLDLIGTVRSLRTNKPFWFYISGFLISSLGQGMMALLFTFYDSYLKLGPWYPYLMMGFGGVTVIAIPAWVRIARRFGKHRAYSLGMLICAASIQAFWLVDPTAHTQAMLALIGGAVLFLVAFTSASAFVAPAAILADIVDYGTWRTGVARAGSYFAFYSLVTKIAMAIGSGAGFILLGVFHYDVKAGAGNSPLATDGLLISVLLVPGVLQAIGGAIIWRFPLDERRHAILQRRIASRPVQVSAQ